MSIRRDNMQNANARNANRVPIVQNRKYKNAYIQNVIKTFAKSVANHNNQ